jgi:hypothetical protein
VKELSFYDQAGVILPGAMALLGPLLLWPSITHLFGVGGLSVGGLGLFIMAAYACGQAVATLAVLLEAPTWALLGGRPSDRLIKGGAGGLPKLAAEALVGRLQASYGIQAAALSEIGLADWRYCFDRMFREVSTGGDGRVDTFNGLFGLNRGLALAAVANAILVAVARPPQWPWIVTGCAVCAGIFLRRMVQFGANFSNEVAYRFLNLPQPETAEP